MRTRKEILESRIARLERLLIGRRSVKNESLDSFNGVRPGMRIQDVDGEVGIVKDVDTISNLRRYNHSGMTDRGGMSKEIVNWEEVDDYCKYDGSRHDTALLVKMDYGYVICCDPAYVSLV